MFGAEHETTSDGHSRASDSPHKPTVSMLSQYTWPRGKPRGSFTRAHADYSFFQHDSSFFSDFYTVPSVTESDTAQKCTMCQKATQLWPPSSLDRSLPEAHALQCNICKRMCHVVCLQKAEALSARSFESRALFALRTSGRSRKKWHCQACAKKPIQMWTCWIPLVHRDIRNTHTAWKTFYSCSRMLQHENECSLTHSLTHSFSF
jgi:hypothetical protein